MNISSQYSEKVLVPWLKTKRGKYRTWNNSFYSKKSRVSSCDNGTMSCQLGLHCGGCGTACTAKQKPLYDYFKPLRRVRRVDCDESCSGWRDIKKLVDGNLDDREQNWEVLFNKDLEFWTKHIFIHVILHVTQSEVQKKLTGVYGGAPWSSPAPSLDKATACLSSGSRGLLRHRSHQSQLENTPPQINLCQNKRTVFCCCVCKVLAIEDM